MLAPGRYCRSVEPVPLWEDRFAIEHLAGAGGMGKVYRALDTLSGQPVAVKVLRALGSIEKERFAREAEVLQSLAHPAIVRFVAHGSTPDGEPFLAIEWLEGEDLGARLRRSGLTVAEALALGARVAEGLGAAHRHGVVHRDVKPGNLWLVDGRPGDVKILDFGIARRRSGVDETITQAGAMIGTPGYMAPEQARGEGTIDERADVFSLGCVLFKCLTGRLPFQAEDLTAVLLKLVLEEPPRLADLRPEVPPALDRLIARMLSKASVDRPTDAEVARELAAVDAGGGGGGAGPASPSTPAITGQRAAGDVRGPGALPGARAAGRRAHAADAGGRRGRARRGALGPRRRAGRARRRIAPGDGACSRRLHRPGGARGAVGAGGAGAAPGRGGGRGGGRGERSARGPFADAAAATMVPGATPGRRVTPSGVAVVSAVPSSPLGEVLDRGVALLRRADAGTIRVDEGIAGLIAAGFELGGDEAGLTLDAERAREAPRTLLGKVTPFVGRERELTTLEAVFAEVAGEGVARAVIVTAPPGVGKSRLRQELLRRLRSRAAEERGDAAAARAVTGLSEPPPLPGGAGGFELWLGRGYPMRAGAPFGLLAPVLRRTAGVLAGEPVEVRRQKLSARLGRSLRGADRARVTVFLGELAGVPFPDDASVELRAARQDAVLMGDQMRRAFEGFVGAECAAAPVLLVLDDVHWGDRPSLQFIDAALRNLADRPLLVIALARPELGALFPGLWAGRPVTEMALSALSRRASEELVRQVLGPDTPAATVERIQDLAGGDAFYLEELVRAVAEGHGDRLPETVLATVEQRLAGLDARERRVLRAASVFGGVFWAGAVQALLGGEGAPARRARRARRPRRSRALRPPPGRHLPGRGRVRLPPDPRARGRLRHAPRGRPPPRPPPRRRVAGARRRERSRRGRRALRARRRGRARLRLLPPRRRPGPRRQRPRARPRLVRARRGLPRRPRDARAPSDDPALPALGAAPPHPGRGPALERRSRGLAEASAAAGPCGSSRAAAAPLVPRRRRSRRVSSSPASAATPWTSPPWPPTSTRGGPQTR